MIIGDDNENKKICLSLFKKFISEVLVRVQQYKDELLASCIELVLSVPNQFIQLSQLVPAIQTAFKIGLSYLPLAQVGLDALERWLEVQMPFCTGSDILNLLLLNLILLHLGFAY